MKGLRRDTSHTLNRSALVVQPAAPFLAWLHEADPTSATLELDNLRLEPSIYLLPETASPDDADRLLRRCFDMIFTRELDGWFRDRSSWPTNRTYQMFQTWFECTYHSDLVDLAKDALLYDQE